MRLEIAEVVGAFHILDLDVPGGKRLEQHPSRGKAEARLAELMAGKAAPVQVAETPTDLLAGKVGEVIHRLPGLGSVALRDLLERERAGRGRLRVIQEIERILNGD